MKHQETDFSPLLLSITAPPVEWVDRLVAEHLRNGADVNRRRLDGCQSTALHLAASRSRLPHTVIERLLKHGADIDARTQNGQTALLLAAATQSYTIKTQKSLNAETVIDTVKTLLLRGADPDIPDLNQLTIWSYAKGNLRGIWSQWHYNYVVEMKKQVDKRIPVRELAKLVGDYMYLFPWIRHIPNQEWKYTPKAPSHHVYEFFPTDVHKNWWNRIPPPRGDRWLDVYMAASDVPVDLK